MSLLYKGLHEQDKIINKNKAIDFGFIHAKTHWFPTLYFHLVNNNA